MYISILTESKSHECNITLMAINLCVFSERFIRVFNIYFIIGDTQGRNFQNQGFADNSSTASLKQVIWKLSIGYSIIFLALKFQVISKFKWYEYELGHTCEYNPILSIGDFILLSVVMTKLKK